MQKRGKIEDKGASHSCTSLTSKLFPPTLGVVENIMGRKQKQKENE